jgi:hypothetical protein
MITVSELIRQLTDIEEEHGDIEVRLAEQPRWAFEYSIQEDMGVAKVKGEMIAYLAEGAQLDYLPHVAAVAVGWSEEREDEDEEEDEE